MRALLVIVLLASVALADDEADCKKGNGGACMTLAEAEKAATKAYEYLQKACAAKLMAGCTEQGQRLMDGSGVAKDEKAGFALWEKACKKDDGRACNNLGTSWSDGNQGAKSVDHKKAKTLYDKACKLKNGFGCFNLGNVYRLGEGIKADPKKATSYFAKSCELDNAKGCTELGIIYYEGKVLPKDQAKALELFEKSCKLGSDVGCKNHKLLTGG